MSDDMIFVCIFYGIPVLAALAFIFCFIAYKKECKKASGEPEKADSEKLKILKTARTVLGIISAVFLSIAIILSGLFFLFITNM